MIRAWLIPGGALLALYAAFYVHFGLQLLAIPYELDQGEGYDVWSAWLLLHGHLPYTDNQQYPYFSSNYPPVWSALVAIPMTWLGPGLTSGRAVAFLSALLAAVVIGLAAYRAARGEGNRLGLKAALAAGLLAALLFLGSPYVFHTTPLARVNATALLFALVGLYLLERPSRGRIILGVVALLAAGFTKPTAGDAALAAGVSLLLRNRRLGMRAAVGFVGAGVAGFGLLEGAAGGFFWLNVVSANANPFDLEELVKYVANFVLIHGILLTVAGFEFQRRWQAGDRSPWMLYLPIAALASLGVGKWGAGESYFLGLIAASSVLGGVGLVRLAAGVLPSPALPVARSALVGAGLLLHGLLSAHGPLSDLAPWLADRGMQAGFLGKPLSPVDLVAAAELATLLRRSEGPVLSESPSLALAANREVVGNATHLRNLHNAGRWDPTNLVADVGARRFGVVVLTAQLFPQPVLDAIGRSYSLDHSIQIDGHTYQVFFPGGN